jgi:tetratricopeptide (TPR) repeat protein
VITSLKRGRGDVFKTVFSRSWDLLSEGAKQILSAMPLFADSAGKEAIIFVSGISTTGVDEGLGQLVEMSLVDASDEYDPGKRRYSVHPLTSNFASRQLAKHPEIEQAKHRRFADYFLECVRRHDGWRGAASLGAMELGLLNSFKAMEWYQSSESLERYVDFHRSTYNLLWTRGYWHKNLTNGVAAVEAATLLNDEEAVAWIEMESLGWTFFCQGDYGKASTHYERSRQRFEKLQDPKGLARVFNYLGRLAAAEERYQESVVLLEEGLQYADDDMSVTFLESALGSVKYAQQDYKAAYQHYSRVRDIREKGGDDVRLCSVVCDLGDLALVTNDVQRARRNYKHSLEIARRVRRLDVTARSQRGLAEIALLSQDVTSAKRYARLASEAFFELGATKEYFRTVELLMRIKKEDRLHN